MLKQVATASARAGAICALSRDVDIILVVGIHVSILVERLEMCGFL